MKNPFLKACLLLLILGMHMFCIPASQAQLTYNFQSTVDNVSDGSGTSPTNLTMDCLAANGIGQWTSSSSTTTRISPAAAGMYLLANFRHQPSSSEPSGIVAAKPFFYGTGEAYPTEAMKNTANLKGQVRYVWLKSTSTRTDFIVEGLDYCAAPCSTGVNLDYEGYPYDGTTAPAQTVKAPIAVRYTDVSTVITGTSHPVVSTANESDPRDHFDVACDGTHLYIAWEEYAAGTYKVYATATLLNGTVVSGYPKLIGDGRRPTISCDVRRTSTVAFDVAYITQIPNGSIKWYSDLAGVSVTMPSSYTVPGQANSVSLTNPLHTRMLTASVAGVTPSASTPRAIYSTVQRFSDVHLVFHNVLVAAPPVLGSYCDGKYNGFHPSPLETGNYDVVDAYLRGFANPYDATSGNDFREYHCLYQLDRIIASVALNKPLMIVPDTITSQGVCVSKNSSGFLTDPDPSGTKYVGAVNQMGIHVHWRTSGNVHFYNRDIRSFDENIEEHTLASGECWVKDGTHHGGTNTPTVKSGIRMAWWSDPDFDPEAFGSISGLTFIKILSGSNSSDPDVSLNIGSSTESAAKLVTLPRYLMNFDGVNNPKLQIYGLSTWEYYGHPHDVSQINASSGSTGLIKLLGSGETMAENTASHGYPTAISNAAIMNFHGGTNLPIGDGITFESDRGLITFLNDQDISVRTSASVATGELEVFNKSIFETSLVFINDGSSTTNPQAIKVRGIANNSDGHYSLNAHNTAFSGRVSGAAVAGRGEIEMIGHSSGGTVDPPCRVKFSGGLMTGIRINHQRPRYRFDCEYVKFDKINEFAVKLSMPTTGITAYEYLTVSDCDFRHFTNTASFSQSNGILVQNFSIASNVMEHVHLIDNTFTTNNDAVTSGNAHPIHAAIYLDGSDGFVEHNKITGLGYQNGIVNTGARLDNAKTTSLICSNYITDVGTGNSSSPGAGIVTDRYAGYAKLNTVLSADRGHIAGISDRSKIVFSRYAENDGPGVDVQNALAFPDLSGVHSASSGGSDYGAFDTISSNAVAQIQLVSAASVSLGDHFDTWGWTEYCRNNVVKGTSSSDLLIKVLDNSNTTDLFDISQNYFEVGSAVDPAQEPVAGDGRRHTLSTWTSSSSDPTVVEGFLYDVGTAGNFSSWQERVPGSISCESSLPEAPRPEHRSAVGVDSFCVKERGNVIGRALNDNHIFNRAYDTLVRYAEQCFSAPTAWRVFTDLDVSVQFLSTDPNRFVSYRDWLKSVLWLNTKDEMWYCACMSSIVSTYQWNGPDRGTDDNAACAIGQWLIEHGKCPMLIDQWKKDYDGTRKAQRQTWLDSCELYGHDTSVFKLDTTLPSLSDLGMDIIKGPEFATVAPKAQHVVPALAWMRAEENPFDRQSAIVFELKSKSRVKFELFDALGRIVQTNIDPGLNADGPIFDRGDHRIAIDGRSLEQGTYYARLSVQYGDVRTVKVVKR